MSTNISLKQQVSEEIPWLFRELGLQITDNDFNPKSFGEA